MSTLTDLPPGLAKGLADFDRWADDRKKCYEHRVDSPTFHYTDANGLIGIVDSDSFWFTDARYLNDPSEFQFGWQFAQDALRSTAEGAEAEPSVRFFCERVMSGLHTAQTQFRMFVASFSRNGDELGQWRAYADDGRGFCLRISESFFAYTESSSDPLTKDFLVVISYDREMAASEQQDGVTLAVEILGRPEVKSACEEAPSIGNDFIRQLAVALVKWIYFVAVGYKHPGYESEKEVRLLLINESEKLQPYVKVGVRRGALVPYIPRPFSPSLCEGGTLAGIRLGPVATSNAEVTVNDLLSAHGIPPATVTIERSPIPYRGARV